MQPIAVSTVNRPDIYSALIDRVMRRAWMLTLVVRSTAALSPGGGRFLMAAQPNLVAVSEITEWSGAGLVGTAITLYHYSLSPCLKRLLKNSATNLTSWLQPELPEDPAFYRKDGSLIMESSSRDGVAHLEFAADERPAFEDLI